MTLTFRDLYNAQPALNALDQQKPKNIKVGYAISKNLELVKPALRSIENIRVGLVMKYGEAEKDKDGKEGKIEITAGSRAMVEYQSEFDLKLDEEVDPDLKIRKITLDQLTEAGVELTLGDLARLQFMIDDGDNHG